MCLNININGKTVGCRWTHAKSECFYKTIKLVCEAAGRTLGKPQACPCPPQYQQQQTCRLITPGTSTVVVRRKCWAFTLRQLNPSRLMRQHQENCFCCSDEPLLFLLSEFLLSVRWLWAAHIPSASTDMLSRSEHADPIFSLRPLFFSSDLLFLVISASLPHSFHIHLLLILCQGYFSQSQSLFSLPWASRTRGTMKRSLLHVLRWLREMTLRPAEDGDGCRSCSERQRLMFCLTAFGVSSKWIFFRDAGRRPRSISQECDTLSDLSFSWFTHHQHCNAHEEPEVWALGPLPCLWWVLISPSFRTWELAESEILSSLLTPGIFCGAAEFKLFSFDAVENISASFHQFMEQEIMVLIGKMQGQKPIVEADDK